MKTAAFLLLFLLTATLTSATEVNDTTVNLKEVTITGARVINKTDRQLYLPTKSIVKASSNGYNFLKKMMIPTLRVDEVNQTISSTEGDVQVRINDIKADVQDILALQPDEVVRVEYINNPGVRYNEDNLAAVINYIVRRRYAGYVGGVSTMQAFSTGLNNSNAYFKYNYKKSEFSLSYRFNYRSYDDRWSESNTTYFNPDGTERKVEYVGIPTDFMYNMHNLQAGYSFVEPDKYTFNIRLNFDWANQPYRGVNQILKETGMQDVLLYNKVGTSNRTPSLDLYYALKLPHQQEIALNAVGTYIGTHQFYRQKEYAYSGAGVEETVSRETPRNDYSYSTDGKKYSLITEGIYTKTFNNAIGLSSGIKYSVSRTDNQYTGAQNVDAVLNSDDLYAFVQLQGKWSQLNYQLGIGGNYISIHQGDVGFDKWTFRPQLTLSTNAIKHLNLRFTSRIMPRIPSLSQLSEVRQQSSTLSANDGNAALTPYNSYSNQLSLAWTLPVIELYVAGNIAYCPDAIMQSIYPQQQSDGSYLFVYKPENQKSFTVAGATSVLTVHAIKQVLNFQAQLAYNSFKSRGLNYSHNYDHWQYYFAADLTLGKWSAEGGWGNASRALWGESISGGEKQSDVQVSYHHKNWYFSLGAILLGYPQGYDYYNETRSQYVKSKGKTCIKDNGNMLYFSVRYNFSHGRKYNATQRKLNNSDNDSGIR